MIMDYLFCNRITQIILRFLRSGKGVSAAHRAKWVFLQPGTEASVVEFMRAI